MVGHNALSSENSPATGSNGAPLNNPLRHHSVFAATNESGPNGGTQNQHDNFYSHNNRPDFDAFFYMLRHFMYSILSYDNNNNNALLRGFDELLLRNFPRPFLHIITCLNQDIIIMAITIMVLSTRLSFRLILYIQITIPIITNKDNQRLCDLNLMQWNYRGIGNKLTEIQ